MRIILLFMFGALASVALVVDATETIQFIDKQPMILKPLVSKSVVLALLEDYYFLPTDLNRLICSYYMQPGIFIPFFQKQTARYHDPLMERNDNLEVQLFGIHPKTLLPVTHRCGLFDEQDSKDFELIVWDKEQIAEDFGHAFSVVPKKRHVGVFKSPFDIPKPHPQCLQVSYNVVSMIQYFCRVNVKALQCDTQAVKLGQQVSRLYLPPGVSVTDFVQSIDAYIALLQSSREKSPFKQREHSGYMWRGVLDHTLDSYERIAPAIREVLADKTGALMPVFWDGGSLEDNVDRVKYQKKTR